MEALMKNPNSNYCCLGFRGPVYRKAGRSWRIVDIESKTKHRQIRPDALESSVAFSLDFDTIEEDFWSRDEENTYNTFYSSVSSFLAGHGDQPFYRIHLIFFIDIIESIKTQIRTVLSGIDRVQILDLNCGFDIVIPSVVFSFKTLVALKLE
ncbi:hypothetical protein V8G54_034507 [Vigna mungo]|uniref:Uncharacterized protein n=1 Tax=Vigna mungo TaxID=3915 RepID=A0AAQ3MRA9_VIGMU